MLSEVLVLEAGHRRVVVELRGEHDLATREELRDLLERLVEQYDLIVIDLTEAEFIDSTVMGTLMLADRLAQERGSRLRIQLRAEGIVRRALEITGLVDGLDCVLDRDRALAGEV